MTRPIDPSTAPDARTARRKRLGRIVRRTLYVKLAIVLGVVVVLTGFYLRLVAGPVSLQSYSARVGDALAARLGPGWTVRLANTAIELHGANPAVSTTGMEVRNPAGGLVLAAPYAVVSLDSRSLLVGGLSPREIELRDLQLRVVVAPDGSLSLLPPGDGPAPPQVEQATASPAPPPPPKEGAASPLA